MFVFDGTAPGLKRATLAARRARRDIQTSNVKKVAEKLLLNNLKRHALEAARADRVDPVDPRSLNEGPSTSQVDLQP